MLNNIKLWYTVTVFDISGEQYDDDDELLRVQYVLYLLTPYGVR